MNPRRISPIERYQSDLQTPGFVRDQAQATAVAELERVYQALLATRAKKRALLRRSSWKLVPGLYFWGGVGRGKTYLMDCFYEALPFEQKLRTHFHRFMMDIHERRRRYSHDEDPLKLVAEEIATNVRVLCFDEFHVSDIADAMILGRLIEVLFANGVTLIATSNLAPDDLYRNGLQRQNFLPAIAALKRNVTVLNVDGGIDYRLRALTRAEIYHTPSDADADADLERWFADIAPNAGVVDTDLIVHGRAIHARRLADGVAWFDFTALCETARSAADYVEIARENQAVLLSRVPQLTREREDPAQRFINLVDEFYDRGVKLIIAADVPQAELYVGHRLKFEFARTLSRLIEMQSQEYLAKPHLP